MGGHVTVMPTSITCSNMSSMLRLWENQIPCFNRPEHAVHMVAVLAGCRKLLVGTGWTISHLVSTNGCTNHSFPLVGGPFKVL